MLNYYGPITLVAMHVISNIVCCCRVAIRSRIWMQKWRLLKCSSLWRCSRRLLTALAIDMTLIWHLSVIIINLHRITIMTPLWNDVNLSKKLLAVFWLDPSRNWRHESPIRLIPSRIVLHSENVVMSHLVWCRSLLLLTCRFYHLARNCMKWIAQFH